MEIYLKFCQKSPLLNNRENYPSINCDYFQNMTNTLRDFSAGNYLKFCQKSPLLNNRQISPSSGEIIHQLIVTIFRT
ncbi:MAG: hypothetical protein SWX82_07720 [Cyanobacteriota bacterium]|nr:hypothetical protein [Cyanobacteriota bacterium]